MMNAKRTKNIMWHKKKSKFIASSLLKTSAQQTDSKNKSASVNEARDDRLKEFAKNFSVQIKNAADQQEE